MKRYTLLSFSHSLSCRYHSILMQGTARLCVQSLELQLCRAHLQFSPKEHVTLPTPTVIALDAILSCKTHVGRLDAVHRVSEIFSACSKIACTDLNGSCFWLTSSSQLLVEVQRELPGLPLDVDRSGLLSRIPDDDDDDMATLASFLQEKIGRAHV